MAASPTLSDTRHLLPKYRDTSASGVDTWLRGVFEGGGAKGIAFKGALEAVEASHYWFDAVAGSSAGAIAAALIACGYSPDEFERPMRELLDVLDYRGPRRAMLAIRSSGQVFSHDVLRDRLDRILRSKCDAVGAPVGHDNELTFEELYKATGIDLYVVAADVSARQPVVFHHRYTPTCQVADAVAASASIPFLFDGGMMTSDSLRLGPNEKREQSVDLFRTVVDGGVWMNFPMFVFDDYAFARYMDEALELEERPEPNPCGPVVGFLLDELPAGLPLTAKEERLAEARRKEASDRYLGARFVRDTPPNARLMPLERTEHGVPVPGVKEKYGADAPRWPVPRRKLHRDTLVLADKALLFASTPFAVLSMMLVAAMTQVILLVGIVAFLWPRVGDWFNAGGWREFAWVLVISAICGVYFAQLLATIVTFGGVVSANWVFNAPARRVLYGVTTTLIATPGAAPWESLRPNVIALPIPAELSTLSAPRDVTDITKQAYNTTMQRLEKIIPPAPDSSH